MASKLYKLTLGVWRVFFFLFFTFDLHFLVVLNFLSFLTLLFLAYFILGVLLIFCYMILLFLLKKLKFLSTQINFFCVPEIFSRFDFNFNPLNFFTFRVFLALDFIFILFLDFLTDFSSPIEERDWSSLKRVFLGRYTVHSDLNYFSPI